MRLPLANSLFHQCSQWSKFADTVRCDLTFQSFKNGRSKPRRSVASAKFECQLDLREGESLIFQFQALIRTVFPIGIVQRYIL